MVKAFMPVPYNINMQLSILSKLNEDAIQILEQILPYFQPAFNLDNRFSGYYWREKRYAHHSRRNPDGR